MAKAIQLKDSNNVALLPITDISLVQGAHASGSDNQYFAYNSTNGLYLTSNNNVGGGNVKLAGSSGVNISYTNNVLTFSATNNHAQHSDDQWIKGEYRSESSTAYVKHSDGKGEVGIYNASGANDAAVTISYTANKGIGIKVANTNTDIKRSVTTDTTNLYYIDGTLNEDVDSASTGVTDKISYIQNSKLYANNIHAGTNIYKAGKEVATKEDITSAIGNSFNFRGTFANTSASGTNYTTLPTTGVKIGWSYLANNAGTYGSGASAISYEKGDLFIATGEGSSPNWTVVQNNLSIAASGKPGTVAPGTTDSQNKIYGVSVDSSNGAMTVNVPWTDHTSSLTSSGTKNSNNVVSDVVLTKSTSGMNTAYTLTVSYTSIASNVTSRIFAGASGSTSSTAVAAQGPAYILHKEGDNVNSKVGFVGDNTWIQVSYTPVNSNIKFEHIGPGSGTTTNSTYVNGTITASGLNGTPLSHGSSLVITGVNFDKDSKGHITKLSYTLGKLPSVTDNDEKVKEIGKGQSDNKTYPVLFSNTNANATSSGKTPDYVASDTDALTNFWYNPSTNILHVAHINSSDSATVLTSVGSNLNYVEGKTVTLDADFVTAALGSSTTDVIGAVNGGTTTAVVNHSAS